MTGTVPVNKELLTGTVPVNKELLTGTVPVNNLFLRLNTFGFRAKTYFGLELENQECSEFCDLKIGHLGLQRALRIKPRDIEC